MSGTANGSPDVEGTWKSVIDATDAASPRGTGQSAGEAIEGTTRESGAQQRRRIQL
jgi:hypothetical protein